MGGHCGVNLLSVPLMFLPCKAEVENLHPLFKDPDGFQRLDAGGKQRRFSSCTKSRLSLRNCLCIMLGSAGVKIGLDELEGVFQPC